MLTLQEKIMVVKELLNKNGIPYASEKELQAWLAAESVRVEQRLANAGAKGDYKEMLSILKEFKSKMGVFMEASDLIGEAFVPTEKRLELARVMGMLDGQIALVSKLA